MAKAAFHKGSLATMTDDTRIVYLGNGDLLYDPDGSGAAVAELIATLSGHPGLSHKDIVAELFT